MAGEIERVRESFTRQPRKTLRRQIGYLIRQMGSAPAVAQELGALPIPSTATSTAPASIPAPTSPGKSTVRSGTAGSRRSASTAPAHTGATVSATCSPG